MATTLLQLVAIAVAALLLRQASSADQQQQQPLVVARPGCRDKCGNITVPYPFGIGAGCYRDDGLGGFLLECDDTRSPPRLSGRGIQLAGFTLAAGEARAYLNVTYKCYNSTGNITSSTGGSNYMSLSGTHYRFSADKTLLISLGCPTLGYFVDSSGYYISGCMSACRRSEKIIPGLCTGEGCCRSSIPRGVDFYEPYVFGFTNGEIDSIFRASTTACRYVFLAEAEWLNTTYSDAAYRNRSGDFTVPLVLDWAVRSAGDCVAARRNATSYACRSALSECVNSTNGEGYRCSCPSGYEGNPYLDDGCRGTDHIIPQFCTTSPSTRASTHKLIL
jgi:hypothetical protein